MSEIINEIITKSYSVSDDQKEATPGYMTN